ncbi:MAG: (4Fe-4S)-binding protein [Bacteroidetes bacterium]|nr:(4Fe-4S)-binding protein [Bacteroidota bacterium]MBP7255813.1 (4Fe-4S)-binding protein [Chitinophagales bacterium]MBK7139715.1 (4Fe-4S)-binding protein [Bacteroidota bacterium]MBK7506057.1 (4Fe-4S)-binding protein [Bacteroidota bacterium]MBK7639559.1 (4Fe-4S)-binding protein [Bacteroidota bacterium]
MEIKNYSNDDITIKWDASKCIHSAICIKGLPTVFNSRERPWIKMDGASTDQIKKQVLSCPSGALSINQEKTKEKMSETNVCVTVIPNGPLMVAGTIQVKDKDGSECTKEEKSFLCRCGASENKPYCDGQHKKVGFVG